MIGYILITIGAWLLYDDYKIAKAKRGGQDELHETGDDRSSGDRIGKPGKLHQKPDGDGRISPIPVKKGVNNGVSKKSVHQVKPNQDRDSIGNDSSGKPDGVAIGDQGESLKELDKHLMKGGQDARNKINNENGVGDNGDDVRLESISGDESNSAEID